MGCVQWGVESGRGGVGVVGGVGGGVRVCEHGIPFLPLAKSPSTLLHFDVSSCSFPCPSSSRAN